MCSKANFSYQFLSYNPCSSEKIHTELFIKTQWISFCMNICQLVQCYYIINLKNNCYNNKDKCKHFIIRSSSTSSTCLSVGVFLVFSVPRKHTKYLLQLFGEGLFFGIKSTAQRERQRARAKILKNSKNSWTTYAWPFVRLNCFATWGRKFCASKICES